MTTLYSCHRLGPGFQLAKFDADFNVEVVYRIDPNESKPHQFHCDCPNWHRKFHCKHINILRAFQANDAVDSSKFYCYETQSWHLPLQTFEEGEASAKQAAEALERRAERIKIDAEDIKDTVNLVSQPTTQPKGLRRL